MPKTNLLVRVVDREDMPVLGNVFFVLTHRESGQKWIDVHYIRAKQAYLFNNLLEGSYNLHMHAVGFEPKEVALTLHDGTTHTELLTVQPRTQKTALVLELTDVDTMAFGGNSSAFSETSRLIASLIDDDTLHRAITRPLDELPAIDTLEHHFAQRLIYLGFPYTKNQQLQRYFWKLIDARVRLALTLTALFSNPDVSAYLEVPLDTDIAQMVGLVIDGLDLLDIDQALLVLAKMHAPWRFVIEEVARSLPGLAHILIPPGIARTMRRDATALVPPRPAVYRRGMAEARVPDNKANQQVVQLAQALVGAFSTILS